MLRLFGSLAGYVTSTLPRADGADLAVHLYLPSTTTVNVGDQQVRVKQESNWPWEGDTNFDVLNPLPGLGIKLRIPAWASQYQVRPVRDISVNFKLMYTLDPTSLPRGSR